MSVYSSLLALACAAAMTVALASTQPQVTLEPIRTDQGLVAGIQASAGVGRASLGTGRHDHLGPHGGVLRQFRDDR